MFKLMPVRYWHRLLIFVLARVSAKLHLSIADGIVLPFRCVNAYASALHPSGLHFLIEIEGGQAYAGFPTNSGVTTLFDVGANAGFVSLTRCRENPNLQAVCFEPHPVTFVDLQKNIALNHLQDRVLAVNVAIGAQSGTLSLYVTGCNSMAAVSPQTSRKELNVISVPVVSLDEFSEQHDLWPDAIKIDVEGCEEQVLLGAHKVMQHAKHLVLEWHSEDLRDRCRSLMQSHGFQVTERGSLLFCERQLLTS
jgi:FkbM family methyltransferase